MLSDNIRKYRKLKLMSQDELAEKLEVTRQSISLWETGQTQPSLDNIVALAKLFGVSTDTLLTQESQPTEENKVTTPTNEKKKNNDSALIFIICAAAAIIIALVVLWGCGVFTPDAQAPESEGASVVEKTNDTPPKEPDTPVSQPDVPVAQPDVPVAQPDVPVAQPEKKAEIFDRLKTFVINNGTVNGDYCYFSNTSDNYGGYEFEDFSLYYWGDTDKIEFCLHCVLDETFSINFFIYVPKTYTGKYDYVTSYYYRDTGESLYEARGVLDAATFTDNYPLNCTEYIGSFDAQNDFMEESRMGICDLIKCIRGFMSVENCGCTFSELGFVNF